MHDETLTTLKDASTTSYHAFTSLSKLNKTLIRFKTADTSETKIMGPPYFFDKKNNQNFDEMIIFEIWKDEFTSETKSGL